MTDDRPCACRDGVPCLLCYWNMNGRDRGRARVAVGIERSARYRQPEPIEDVAYRRPGRRP